MTAQMPLFSLERGVSAYKASPRFAAGESPIVGHLQTVVEAESGTKRLRELILHLAFRGALLPQVEKEGTSEPLIGLIAARRQLLLSTRERADRSAVTPEEQPFQIPASWSWVRLGQLGIFLGGGTPAKSNAAFWNGSIPWVSPKDMKRPYISDAEDHISEAAISGSAAKIIPSRSALFVVRGMILAHSFPVALTTRPVAINQDMKALVPAVPEMDDYILRVCRAARVRVLARVERSSHGTCRLDSAMLEELPVPLPPLAEQKRIVAKVDQLMALCDELEAKQAKKREVGDRLTKAALRALTLAEGPEEFDAAWKRVAENFEELIDRPEKVKDLRGAVLVMALCGRFSRQYGDADAFEEICQVKPQVERVVTEDQPHALPKDWAWLRLQDLVQLVTDGDHQPPPKEQSGVPFLTIGNISNGRIDFSETRFVSRSYFDGLDPRRVPKNGDILYTVVGATYGRPVLVDVAREFCVQRHVAIIRPDESCERGYLYLFLRSPLAYAQATASITGTAQPTVPLKPLRRFLVPVPPRSEQRRMVSRMNQLLAMCDDLEAKLRARDEKAAKLAEALVAEVLA